MKRRGFLAALAAVSFLRRFAKAAPVVDDETFFAVDRTVDSNLMPLYVDSRSEWLPLDPDERWMAVMRQIEAAPSSGR